MSAVLTRVRTVQPPDRPPRAAEPIQAPSCASRSTGGFAALLGACRSSGGTARGDDLAQLLQDHCRGDYVSLARLIVGGEIFAFGWRQTLWVPMFQFDPRDLSVKKGLPQVLATLPRDSDGWATAAWFTEGHARLGGRRPVDMVDSDMSAVQSAAQSTRTP